MSRYIDADKFISWLDVGHLRSPSEICYCEGDVKTMIDMQPTADVVEVVRCKDCKWWDKQEDSIQGRCALSGHYPTGAWYCANGERKQNER